MTSVKAHIAVSGNIPKLVSAMSIYGENSNIKFTDHSFLVSPKYQVFIVNIQGDLENISQNIISIYSKCRENNAKLLLCVISDGNISHDKIDHFQKLLSDLGKDNPLHRLLITRDLYTNNYPNIVTNFDKEIEKILKNDSINISVKGNNLIYPLHLNDFIEVIIKILFLNSTTGKILYILGEPIKDLELAYLVKKIVIDDKPNYQINSNTENIPEDPEIVNLSNNAQVNLSWSPSIDFENSLKEIYQKINNSKEEYQEQSIDTSDNKIMRVGVSIFEKITRLKYKILPYKKTEEIKTNQKRRLVGYLLTIGASLYLLTCAIFAFSIYQSYQFLAKALNSLREGNVEKSVLMVRKTIVYDQIAINIYWPIRPMVKAISGSYDEELHNLFSFNQYLQSSLENLQQSYVLSEKIYLSLVDNSQNNNIENESLALKSSLGQIYDNLNQIDIMINSGKLPKDLSVRIKDSPDFKRLGNLEIQLTQAMKLINILPIISSTNNNKQIAIVVQDQDELRSLGGVIKYLIILNIDKGKLSDVKIYDQNSIDSLNDGSIKAPETIALVSGSESWKFRDMSYVGDFSQTSQYLSWFLEKTIQAKPDVFISINKSLFEKLIGKEGNLIISGKNISQISLKNKINEADIGNLRLVIDYYVSQYRNQKLSLAQLSRVVIDEIENNNIYIWAKDPSVENTISNLPFSGVVNPYNCHSALANYSTCINQTTYLTESNFSVSPINQYLNREVVHLITLNQNEAIHEYQLKYHFLSDLSSLNRDYRLIYQLYIPSGSNIISVTVDDQELQSSSFVKQKYNQFEYIQIPIALSINTDHQVKIKFSSTIQMSSDINQTAYSLTEIRQSGLNSLGYGLIINLPENSHAALVTSPVDTKPQQIYYRFPTKTATFGLGLGLTRL